MAAERTEAPTPKRRGDVRKEGRVGRSRELSTATVLLASVVALRLVAGPLARGLATIMISGLAHAADRRVTATGVLGGANVLTAALSLLLPLFAVVVLAALAVNAAQGGLVFSLHPLQPKLERVNPVNGAKRLLSADGAVRLLRSSLNISVVGLVVWLTIQQRRDQLALLGGLPLRDGASQMVGLAQDVALKAGLAFLVIGLADYAWTRRRFLQSIRMTKAEVKQELRQTEGDPLVKQRIRRQRYALLQRMMQAVPKADVVVTNPTHVAVALKYDPLSMRAPRVVAKGEGYIAQRIREVAEAHRVPVVQNVGLARALHKAVKVGGEVPPELYVAAAEVLAWVYRLRGRVPTVA